MRSRGVLVPLLLVLLASAAALGGPADELRQAEDYRRMLMGSASLRQYRSNWEKGIELYKGIARGHAKEPVAAKALLEAGSLTAELARFSGVSSDLSEAAEICRTVAKQYPSSPLADDALYRASRIAREGGDLTAAHRDLSRLLAAYPKGDLVPFAQREIKAIEADPRYVAGGSSPSTPEPTSPSTPAGGARREAAETRPPREEARPSPDGLVFVEGVRPFRSPEYTRVVVDVSGPVRPTQFTLPVSPAAALPQRIVVDIPGATLRDPKGVQPIDLPTGPLKRIRYARFSATAVRVVLETDPMVSYQTFTLPNPDRIVLDIHAPGTQVSGPPAAQPSPIPEPTPPAAPAPTLAEQLGLETRRIIIDAGHGGKDPGAIGPTGLKEKDVVLDVARLLKKELEQRLGLEVVLTRDSDVFLELDERTAVANQKKGDLFLSIHANASRRRQASGIETYYLNLASSREAAETAARENMTSVARIGDLEKIIADLLVTTKVSGSSQFAKEMHGSLVSALRSRHKGVQDLGVKQAPFFVLIGATMPSVLAEISFISNRTEEERLASPEYRALIASAIAQGVERHLKASQRGG